jgi:hypothetical protein
MKETNPPVSLTKVREIGTTLSDIASHPDELDDLTSRLGIPPILVNAHLATEIDLSAMGLGKAIYIPVQISGRHGGRKSLYFLHAGEKVLSGIFVTSVGIGYRYTTRETGDTIPSRTGDRYSEEIRGADGKVLALLKGSLQVTDISRGEGSMLFDTAEPATLAAAVRAGAGAAWVWIAWSFIVIVRDPLPEPTRTA